MHGATYWTVAEIAVILVEAWKAERRVFYVQWLCGDSYIRW
jgi:hypothetical protein